MIRKLTLEDRDEYIALLDEFYHSPAVMHPIPYENYAKTFDEICSGSPFMQAFLLECDGKTAGYGQVSFSWSTESGGLVVWLEELYLRPQYQGKGLGTEYFDFIHHEYGEKATRYRLEVEPDNLRAMKLYRQIGYSDLPYLQMVKENGTCGAG